MMISKVSPKHEIPSYSSPYFSQSTDIVNEEIAVVTPSPQKRKHAEISKNIIRKEITLEPNLKRERKTPKAQPSKPLGIEVSSSFGYITTISFTFVQMVILTVTLFAFIRCHLTNNFTSRPMISIKA